MIGLAQVTQLAFFNGQSLSAALLHATWQSSDSRPYDCADRSHQSLRDYEFFKRRIHALLGDLTFQEAYDRRSLSLLTSESRL